MNKIKYPLIYIEWCDAIESNEGWQDINVIKYWAKTSDWIVKECGFLIEETKEYIVFASRIGNYHDDNEPKFGGINKIPNTWIKKRISLIQQVV
jgi:hypothetical protein